MVEVGPNRWSTATLHDSVMVDTPHMRHEQNMRHEP